MGFVSLVALVWEIFEFWMDSFFQMNLQRTISSGVKDTMGDMIVALLGGFFFFLFYVKKKKNKKFSQQFNKMKLFSFKKNDIL